MQVAALALPGFLWAKEDPNQSSDPPILCLSTGLTSECSSQETKLGRKIVKWKMHDKSIAPVILGQPG